MRINIISFTEKGDKLNKALADLFQNEEVFGYGNSEGLITKTEKLKDWTEKAFRDDAIIFVGAVGIAVRASAPFIRSKEKDPAVIAVDEIGKFVVPVLSGHIGGANELAFKIAEFIGAQAVITTATDIRSVWAADVWAVKHNCLIADISKIKFISGALLKGENIGFLCDFPISGKLPDGVLDKVNLKNGVVISFDENKRPFENTLNIIPKIIDIGAGSRKNADRNSAVVLLEDVFRKKRISLKAVRSVNTIDIKKNEKSILELCKKCDVKLNIFTAEELLNIEGKFSSSDFVRSVTGVDNVCERAACLAFGGKLILRKTSGAGVTIAAAVEEWRAEFENCDGRN